MTSRAAASNICRLNPCFLSPIASYDVASNICPALLTAPCLFGHDPKVCRCHLELIRTGQDESVLKAYSLPKGVWIICGVGGMRKKSDGPGEMASGFQDEVRGFGLKLTDEELGLVNAFRYNRVDGAGISAPPLKESDPRVPFSGLWKK